MSSLKSIKRRILFGELTHETKWAVSAMQKLQARAHHPWDSDENGPLLGSFGGVYVIWKDDETPIYVGISGDLLSRVENQVGTSLQRWKKDYAAPRKPNEICGLAVALAKDAITHLTGEISG